MSIQDPIFHEGELAIQRKLGVAEQMDTFARRVVRDYMPQQHQDFYQQLPMLFVGFTDSDNHVWASVLPSQPGFIDAKDDKTLSINQMPVEGDPLNRLFKQKKETSSSFDRLGFLGIDLSTRRRNRLSGEIRSVSAESFDVNVIQAFGNCPQYIQVRDIEHIEGKRDSQVERFNVFDNLMMRFISNSDTFFVASSTRPVEPDSLNPTSGADVSHRGGQPGFIRVDNERTLTIPDYMGNNHFNTLGNILINPNVGLLFIDFEKGDIYTMTGSASILWDESETNGFKGAERLWQFKLDHGYVLRAAMPWRMRLKEWSPNSLMTDTWPQLEQRTTLEAAKGKWHRWKIERVVSESDAIKSFYFEVPDDTLPTFKAGQFITVKMNIEGQTLLRNYSVSSAPNDTFFRISVKKDGLVSNWLHNNATVNSTLDIKLPEGKFHLASLEQPVVLISAGVGITPMVSMLRHILNEGTRTRKRHPTFVFSTFRNESSLAFKDEIDNALASQYHNVVTKWLVTKPENPKMLGDEFEIGRLSREILGSTLPFERYAFYLCGPGQFMQDVYDLLVSMGAQDKDIHVESFGPSALQRIAANEPATSSEAEPADSALVVFSKSQVEQVWRKSDGSLLEFAEGHGFTPDFSCRNGTCGTCKTKLEKGNVTHRDKAQVELADDETLLCCAMPAAEDNKENVIVLDI